MRDISELPMEFKTSKKEQADGLYIIPHPWIKNYFFECKLEFDPDLLNSFERVSIRIVTIKKDKVKSVLRNCTFVELQNIRDAFYLENERVVQVIPSANMPINSSLKEESILTKLIVP